MSKERQFEQRVQRELTTCSHFNGVVHETCKAGVNYHELCGSGVGCFAKIPCTNAEGSVVCDKRQFPTREQAEQVMREDDSHLERFVKANNAAHAHAKTAGLGRGKGGRGEMPCPLECGGVLRYSVAGVNGHMHAACSTKGCMSWME